ncbi:MAG: hypothetical protein ACLGH3_03940 [Actinomycetota bacterium]
MKRAVRPDSVVVLILIAVLLAFVAIAAMAALPTADLDGSNYECGFNSEPDPGPKDCPTRGSIVFLLVVSSVGALLAGAGARVLLHRRSKGVGRRAHPAGRDSAHVRQVWPQIVKRHCLRHGS